MASMDTITRAVSICRFAHISTLSCSLFLSTHTPFPSRANMAHVSMYACLYMFWFRRHCGLLGNMWHLEPNGRAWVGRTVGSVDKVNGQRHDRKNNVAFYFSRQQFAHRTRYVHIIGFAGSTHTPPTHSHTHIHTLTEIRSFGPVTVAFTFSMRLQRVYSFCAEVFKEEEVIFWIIE